MKPVWFDSYPPGVPEQINIEEFESILDVYRKSIQEHAHRAAYTSFDHTVSYAELDAMTRRFSRFLQQDLGLKKGDRFGIMLPNIIQYPVAVFSAVRLGLIVVNIDPLYTQRELKHQLLDSGAKTLLVLENFAAEVEKCMQSVPLDHLILTRIGDALPTMKASILNAVVRYIKKAVPAYHLPKAHHYRQIMKRTADVDALVDASMNREDTIFLQYTGGTTGVPKGVEISHGNIVATMMMSREWMEPRMLDPSPRIVAPLPMYHIFCMAINLMAVMNIGAENILVANPRDFPRFVRLLQSTRFTGFVAVNTLLRKLLDTPGFEKIDFSSLELTVAGGMAVTKDVADEWYAATGSHIAEGYGLSEASPSVSLVPMNFTRFTGSIGLPLPSTQVMILDDDDNELGFNEPGELCIKGPQVMRGYWNNAAETAKVFTDQGYLRTGDYVRMDDKGFLYMLDRKKDMILVSGFNVFPNEIEDVVNQHPKVTESAAIGIEDREAGEVVKLFVVASDASVSKEELSAYCREHLTGYKRPREIEFVDDLPKSNIGKILRRQLQPEHEKPA